MATSRAFAAALAALVLSVLGLATHSWRQQSCPADAAALLLRAGGDSPLRPRWSGCFGSVEHGAPALLTPFQIRGALAEFEVATGEGRRGGAVEFGAALALAGETARALSTLETAAASGRDADALSNLAAAHLVASDDGARTRHVLLALDFATHAVTISPHHAAARFNQAIALTQLRLDDEAARAWRGLLDVDELAGVRADIEGALGAITNREAAAKRFDRLTRDGTSSESTLRDACAQAPQTCRERIEDIELPSWGEAHLRGDAGAADAALGRATLLAGELRTRGEPLDAESVDDIQRAISRRENRVGDLAAGIAAYGRARAAQEDDRESLTAFRDAETRLGRAASPMAGWARCQRVFGELNTYSGEQMEAAGQALHAWTAEALTRGSNALAGRLAYLEAVTFINRAEYARAEALYPVAVDAFERAGETDNLAGMQVAMASARLRLGETDTAWDDFGAALRAVPDMLSARRRYVVLLNVGMWVEQRQMPYASALMLSSARDTAVRTNQGLRVAESSLYRARAYRQQGDLAAARADLETARPDPAKNGAWGRGERALHEYLAGVAEVEAASRPQVAVDAATTALGFFTRRGANQRVAPLYLTRGRAYAALGQSDRADEDYAAGIAAYSAYRAGLASAQQRILSQEVVWDLYEERLQLAAKRSSVRALQVAEDGRARALLESMPGASGSSIDPARLADILPPGMHVIYYSVLPRRLLTWTIGHHTLRFQSAPLDREGLERTVARVHDALAGTEPRAQWRTEAETLFDTLLRPALPAAANGQLVIIPDGALHRLPFAALVDRASGRFLVESWTVTTAPSASVLAQLLQRPLPAGRPRTLLAVGNPATGDARLAALPGAEQEASVVSALYDRTRMTARGQATRAAFLEWAPDADVIHFAGHAFANPEYPTLAHLEFAATADGRPSALDATDIAALSLSRTRLVVLAACTTGGGSIRRGEGVLSLAHPFLAAGAPSVLATLWDIDDRASAQFLEDFHRRFVARGSAAAALREAQTAALTTLPPSVWAAFTFIGRPADTSGVEDKTQ